MPVAATAFDRMLLRDLVDRLPDLLGQFTPDEDLGLSTDVPIALLPVRLEARFDENAAGAATAWTLRVRIIPDDIHVAPLYGGLTDREVALGKEFASAPHPGDADSWARLVRGFGETAPGMLRAAWVAKAALAGGLTASVSPPLAAAALPDRWFVSAWKDDHLVAWATSESVRSPLHVDPINDQADVRWITEFAEARAAGMAVELGLAVPEVDVLLATGVRSGQTPEAGAVELHALLEAQSYSRGVDLLSPGTPTNNTPAVASSWRSLPDAAFIRRREFEPPPVLAEGSNGVVATQALGLATTERALTNVAGAPSVDQPAAKAMLDVLWPVTGGEMLAVMLSDRQPGGRGVTAEIQEFVRQHASGFVRGRGPLPTLLIGHQPYGILPAVSLARWKPHGVDNDMVQGLRTRLFNAWSIWEDATRNLPRLGALDDSTQATELVAQLLATSPVPDPSGYLARSVDPPNFSRTLPYFPMDGPIDGDLAAGLLQVDWIPLVADTREQNPRPVHVVLPSVAPDAGVRLGQLAALDSSPHAVAGLESASVDLLTQLVQFGLVRSSERTASDVGVLIAEGVQRLDIAEAVPRMMVQDLGEMSAKLTVDMTLRDLGVTDEAIALDTPLAVALNDDALLTHLHVTMPQRSAEHKAAVAALALLSGLDDSSLELLMGETLDVFANRYDAWVTSLATRRLADLRATRPEGVHVGAFGWLIDLKAQPATPAGAAAFVHAPSTAHAATAAVLRHADLDDRATTVDQSGNARRFDLTAASVRRARSILDAVREGQPLAAVLGYRIERFLQDHGESGRIGDLRLRHPLVGSEPPDPQLPAEAIPAHDVVDGVAVWTEVAAGSDLGFPPLADELRFTVDALSDLLVAEGVHHIVRGDRTRASATLAALARGLPPPADLHVIDPPGRHITVPMHLVMSADAAALGNDAGWSSDRPRARLAPAAERLARSVLADPSTCAFRVRTGNGDITVALGDLGVCALDVLAEVGPADDHSAFAARIRQAAGVAGDVLADAPDGTTMGWAAFSALARLWAGAFAAARPLLSSDIAVDPQRDAPAAPPADPAAVVALDLEVRREIEAIEAAGKIAAEAVARVDLGSPAEAETAGLAPHLAAFQHAGLNGSAMAVGETAIDVARRCVPLARAAAARLKDLDAPQPTPPGGLDLAPHSADNVSERTERLCALVRDVFGAPVVVAPAVPLPPEAIDTNGLPGSDELADWLGELSEVRPATRRWWSAMLATEAITNRGPNLVPAQYPRPETESWIGGWTGTPTPWTPPLSARRAFIRHDVGSTDAVGGVGGLIIESWVEHVPVGLETELAAHDRVVEGDKVEATGLALNYNSADARPPQAIVLAVASDRAVGSWHLADLIATLLETLELTRFRAVEPPADLPSRWLLPAIFVPDGVEGLSLGRRLNQLDFLVEATFVSEHWRRFGNG
jgi:hypothetical protein